MYFVPLYATNMDTTNSSRALGMGNFVFMDNSSCNWTNYAPTNWYTNTMIQPVQAQANIHTTGKISSINPSLDVYDTEEPEPRVMQTPFYYNFFSQFAESESYINNCQKFSNHIKDFPKQEVIYPSMNQSLSSACLVENAPLLNERQAMPNMPSELNGVNSQSGDVDELNEFASSDDIIEKRNEKTPSIFVISKPIVTTVEQKFVMSEPMITTIKQDDVTVDLTCLGHLDRLVSGQVLSKSKELCESDKKTPELNITLERESLDESIMEKPNPNDRGRASASWESSSEASFESKEYSNDMSLSDTSSSRALSDESSISDFIVYSQSSSESNYEVREAFARGIVPMCTATLDFKSKLEIIKPISVSKTAITDDTLLMVSRRDERDETRSSNYNEVQPKVAQH